MIIMAGLLILVSVQNMQPVTFRFIKWDIELSLILLIYVTFFGGFVFGILYSKIGAALSKFKERRSLKALGKK
jgi:uncharacterized integral membrane protein